MRLERSAVPLASHGVAVAHVGDHEVPHGGAIVGHRWRLVVDVAHSASRAARSASCHTSAGAAAGTIHLAYKLLAARAADVAADTGAADPPTPAKVRSLASSLLAAADTAQAAVRSDGRVDRMANSHTRARGMVRVALDAHPVPFAHYVDESAKWEAALARAATALLTLTAELTEGDQ